MRKLVIMAASSTRQRLVLMHDDDKDGTGDLYEVDVTDQLRRIITPTSTAVNDADPTLTPTDADQAKTSSTCEGDGSSPAGSAPRVHANDPAQTQCATPAESSGPPAADAVLSLPSTRKNQASTPVVDLTPSTPVLPMRPRDIQNKIRHGASVDDIAAECGVDRKEIIPWAHPILQERERMATLARATHPSLGDESSTLTLSELVATELASHSIDPSTAHWDAYKNPANRWVVVVTWPGICGPAPEWELCQPGKPTSTTLPLTAAARTITGLPKQPPVTARSDEPVIHGQDALIPPPPGAEDAARPSDSAQGSAPKKRKRSAETPHWEDILLGVRASTKRPRK